MALHEFNKELGDYLEKAGINDEKEWKLVDVVDKLKTKQDQKVSKINKYVCVCGFLCVYVCMGVCVCVCVRFYVCMYMYVYVYLCMYSYTL